MDNVKRPVFGMERPFDEDHSHNLLCDDIEEFCYYENAFNPYEEANESDSDSSHYHHETTEENDEGLYPEERYSFVANRFNCFRYITSANSIISR